jgi:DNA-binding MarR family transcriptional regulator
MYIHASVKRRRNIFGTGNTLAPLPCMCANLRRAARAITRLYNRELRSGHIEITQFTLLMTLDRTGEVSQGQLGRLLALDSTTLTRILEPLRKKGWIGETEGDDRRFRMIRLTAAGRAKLGQSIPHWKRAQSRVQEAIGEQTMNQLSGMLERVTAMATEE